MKRIVSVILSLTLALGLMAGCGAAAQDPEDPAELDWDALRAKYDLGTEVLSIDGETADWGEFFYWLFYSYKNYVKETGEITDFDAPYIYDESLTVGEMLIDAAKGFCVQYHALSVNAAKEGVELTEEDEAALQEAQESEMLQLVGEDGTEEEFFELLDEAYVSRELFDLMNRTAALYSRAYTTLYGGAGEKLTEQEVLDFAEENGFMTAKHILIRTTDDEGEPLDEAAKAEKRAVAEELYAGLKDKSGAELEEAFDALMQEKSEDTGLAAFPDGYCFTSGEMLEAFETATAALEPGQMSWIVESDFGYHIILRLPLTPEDRVMKFDSDGTPYTIRAMAAVNLYEARRLGWIENADVSWAPGFEDLEIKEMFGL